MVNIGLHANDLYNKNSAIEFWPFGYLYSVAAGRGGGRGGHSLQAALSRGRNFEGRKYGILKNGR